MCKVTSRAWAAILTAALLLSTTAGFRLVHEEFRSATSETGATLHYRVNPDVQDAIKVEVIHRSYLNHPRASHPAAAEMHFRDQIGGTTQGYYGKPRSVHGEVWSLLSNGRVDHARDLHKAVMEEDHNEVHRQRMGVRRLNNRDERRHHEEARTRFKETASNVEQQMTVDPPATPAAPTGAKCSSMTDEPSCTKAPGCSFSKEQNKCTNPCALEKDSCDKATGCDWIGRGKRGRGAGGQCISSAKASLEQWDQPASEPPAIDEWRCRYRCGRLGQTQCGDPVDLDSETACRQLGCGHRDCLLVAAVDCEIQKKTARLDCYKPLEKGNDAIGKEAHYDPEENPEKGPEIIADLSASGMKPHKAYLDIPSPDFWTGALDDLKKSNMLAPNINAYACVEVDVTLPGIVLEFGLMGGMALDTGTGCWTLTIEGSFGVFFGFKVLSVSIGINIHVAGTFSMEETPGDDGKCVATSNPFSIIRETGEMLKTGLSKDERVQKKIQESINELKASDAYKGFDDYKLDRQPAMKVEASQGADSYGAVQDTLLRRSIVAVYGTWPWVEEKIMAYAAQALDLLVDVPPGKEPTAYYAEEGAGTFFDSKAEKDAENDPVNYEQTTGRFLARKLSSVTAKEKAKAHNENTKINIFDDRVHNFPASARMSEWNGNPYFWREYAISGANLFIRVVKDLQAVFNSYIFGQAEWDGDCASLPAKFYPVDESEKGVPTKRMDGDDISEDGKSPFSDHHWASPFKADSRKLDTGKQTAAFWKTSGLKNWVKVRAAIYPHVLCHSFKISTEGSDTDKDFVNSAKSGSKGCVVDIVKSDKSATCEKTADCLNWRGGPDAVECTSGKCVCKPGFCALVGTCVSSGRAQPLDFDEKAFFGAREPEKKGSEPTAEEMAKWKLAQDGVDLYFPKAREVILGGEKVTHSEYETASLKGVFITAFPQFSVRIMELYVKISEHLQQIDHALCEHHVSEADFDKELDASTTQEQIDKLFKSVARHLPARNQHQFAALMKKSAELHPPAPAPQTAVGKEESLVTSLLDEAEADLLTSMDTKTRLRRRRQQADGHASGGAAGLSTGSPFPQPTTECEDGSAPDLMAVNKNAIAIVDHVRTLLLQLSANDFSNAESIWKGELKVPGAGKKTRWYGRMSNQPALAPGKGQTHMPDLLSKVLKEQVPLVPKMRQDWATALKVESAGKKCCVQDVTIGKAECGIIDTGSCPPDSRWQRGSIKGDLGDTTKAAEGGCCGPTQWKSLNKMSNCEVTGCVVEDDEQSNGMGGEKVLLMGTHFRGVSKALGIIQTNVDAYKTSMESRAVGNVQRQIANGLRTPIVEYTLTFTLDIESSPPGFCTPSSSLLQVVGSVSWAGSTGNSEPMTMQACVAARVHPPDFYFMLSFCLQQDQDLADSSGSLDSIDDGKNGVQTAGKQTVYKVSFEVFAYLAKASPLAPDPNIMAMVEPLKNLFLAGGPQAIAGALMDSASSGVVPGAGEVLMKIAMASPPAGVSSALMQEPGPAEDLGAAIGAVGMSLSVITVFVQGMLLSVASGGLESASDYLTVDPTSFSAVPVSLDMELVANSVVEFELTWRACRLQEIDADLDKCKQARGKKCNAQIKAEIRKTCTRLVRPFKKTTELHFASWNRLAVTFVAPLPFGAAKIQPLFGLEIDFDFTPLWELMENHGRYKINMRRQQACAACLHKSSRRGDFVVTGLKKQSAVIDGWLSEVHMQYAIAKQFKVPSSEVQVMFKEFKSLDPVSGFGAWQGRLCCVQDGITSDNTFVPDSGKLCSSGPQEVGKPWLEYSINQAYNDDGDKGKTCCKDKMVQKTILSEEWKPFVCCVKDGIFSDDTLVLRAGKTVCPESFLEYKPTPQKSCCKTKQMKKTRGKTGTADGSGCYTDAEDQLNQIRIGNLGTADSSSCFSAAVYQLKNKSPGNAVYTVSVSVDKKTGKELPAPVAIQIQNAITASFAKLYPDARADKWKLGQQATDMAFCDSRYKLADWKPSNDDQCQVRGPEAEAMCTKEILHGSDVPNHRLIGNLISLHTIPVWIDLTNPERCERLDYKQANSDDFSVEWIKNDASVLHW